MKILIDEQLPVKLKYRFTELGYDVSTVRDMNWLGFKNGQLIKTMIIYHFDVLLTNDKNLYYQQRIKDLEICILNVNSKTNRYHDILNLLKEIVIKLALIEHYLTTTKGGYFML